MSGKQALDFPYTKNIVCYFHSPILLKSDLIKKERSRINWLQMPNRKSVKLPNWRKQSKSKLVKGKEALIYQCMKKVNLM